MFLKSLLRSARQPVLFALLFSAALFNCLAKDGGVAKIPLPSPDNAGRINGPMIEDTTLVLSGVTNAVSAVYVPQAGRRTTLNWQQVPNSSEVHVFALTKDRLAKDRLAGTNIILEVADKSQQFPEGRITFAAIDAKVAGGVKISKQGPVAELTGWSPAGSATWDFKPTRWGNYHVELTYAAPNAKEQDNLEIKVAGQTLRRLPVYPTESKSRYRTAFIAAIYIAKAEPFQVTITADELAPNRELVIKNISLIPAPEGRMPAQEKDEALVLDAGQATTHSVMMRYEPQDIKKCLGYWVNTQDWADWRFLIKTPGHYEVELLQGCGTGHGGSDVDVVVRSLIPRNSLEKSFQFVVQETGHFQKFIPRVLGTVHFEKPGFYNLAVKPKRKQGGAVMDIRQINLKPVTKNAEDKPNALEMLDGKRIVVLGDSITYGGEYVEMVESYLKMKYPNAKVDIINLGLPSETVSGLSEPGHAGGSFPRPGLHERLDRVLAKTKPKIVVACYGMNDGIYYPFGEERFQAYQDGILKLRQKAETAGAEVVHLTPPVFDSKPLKGRTLPAGLKEYTSPFEGYDEVLDRYSKWLLSQKEKGWKVIDIHGPMSAFIKEKRKANPDFLLAGDGVHANTQGNWIIAREILAALGAPTNITQSESSDVLKDLHLNAAEILKLVQQRHRTRRDTWLNEVGHKRPGMSKGKPVTEAEMEAKETEAKLHELLGAKLPGKRSNWNGFDRYDFQVDGKDVLVVAPKNAAPGKPWVWHGEFFGHKPAPDIALLGLGFHAVYMSVPDMLGSPKAVAHWNKLHAELTSKYGFSSKPALVGFSRGGLYCYNWAAANPDKVSCIYGDAPVCDFKSWPGAFGKGKRSDRDWNLVLQEYGFKDDAEAKAYTKNPVDNLKPLAEAKVPLLHVFGDADEVVPWDENTGLVAERYKAMGGTIELIRKPGVKHHPHGLDDSTPIVNFILKHAAPTQKQSSTAALH